MIGHTEAVEYTFVPVDCAAYATPQDRTLDIYLHLNTYTVAPRRLR